MGTGTSGGVVIAGAGSQTTGPGAVHLSSNQGKNSQINILSSDPDVTMAALESNVITTQGANNVADYAINQNASVAGQSIDAAAAVAGGSEAVAQSAITTGAATTGADLSFAQSALANSTTGVENLAAEYAQGLSQATSNAQTTANNVATGSGQAIDQQQLPTNAQESGGVTSLGTWVTIIAGILAIYFYVKKGRA